MTYDGIRWHVSVHGWPLILIPVSIRSYDGGTFLRLELPRCLSSSYSLVFFFSPSLTVECVSFGIGYRTTNVPFSLTTIILQDLSCSIFSRAAATNYYPFYLIPRRSSVSAARHSDPMRYNRVYFSWTRGRAQDSNYALSVSFFLVRSFLV